MAISNKQRIAMAVIVLAGLLGGAAVLRSERVKTGGEDAEHVASKGGREEGHAEGESTHEKGEHEKGEQEKGVPEQEEHGKGTQEKGHPEKGERAEGQVTLTREQLESSGITVRAAGPATLQAAARFPGEIRFNEDRTAHVVPRLAGVAEAVTANLGQVMQKGQVLAVIASTSLSEQRSEWLTAQRRLQLAKSTYEREKTLWQEKISAQQDYLQAQSALQEAEIAVLNASQKLSAVGAGAAVKGALNRLEIRAPFAGTIVEKHLSLGESVKEDASIFTVSDLGSVWAEFAVAPKDLGAVRVGQKVVVSSTAFASEGAGTVSYVGALLGEQTRTARARVTLANPAGAWRPGLFVTVAVLGEDQDLPLAVGTDAVQTIDTQPMLFLQTPGGFIATPVKLGRSDGKMVEVLNGLKPGDRYAAANTFVLKSELGKASAEHGH